MVRERGSIDLGDFSDLKNKTNKPSPAGIAEEAGRAEGFTSREKPEPIKKIDGRSLRKTGRKEQLNMAVKPETRARFWSMAKENGFTTGEEFLLSLMDVHQ